jgi:hypothetical protein
MLAPSKNAKHDYNLLKPHMSALSVVKQFHATSKPVAATIYLRFNYFTQEFYVSAIIIFILLSPKLMPHV